MTMPSIPSTMSNSFESVTAVPTIEQIYKQRAAVDTLSAEIEATQKLFDAEQVEKKKQLQEQQTLLANFIRQANAALNQIAVPVMPEPDVPVIDPPIIPQIPVLKPTGVVSLSAVYGWAVATLLGYCPDRGPGIPL